MPRRLAWAAAIVLLLGGGGFAAWYFGFRGPTDDLGRFQGDWKLTTGGRQEADDGRAQVAVRIAGDRWQYIVGGVTTKTLKMTLNEAANPKEIELTLIDAPKGTPPGSQASHGIYAIDGNSARVVVVPADRPRPASLEDPGENVWVLTRVRLEVQKGK